MTEGRLVVPPSAPRGQLTLIDCLCALGALQGAAGGAIWGWDHYGVLGAVLGLPVGAVVGFFALFLLLIAVFFVGVGVLAASAFWRGGRKGLAEFLRHGPEGLRGDNPPGAGETEQPRSEAEQ